MTTRPINFSGGPATLPESVLTQVQAELFNWQDTGISILETSHRSAEFRALNLQTQAKLRKSLSIPDHYKILFITGPTRTQFSMVPQNLLTGNPKADYMVTGLWSALAAKEAERYGDIVINQHRPDSAYCYYCPNETVQGLWTDKPDVSVPIIADMTSCLLMGPENISNYGLIFAGIQKNLGPAGLTVVIVREDLIQAPQSSTPSIATYQNLADYDSLIYTPNCFAIYCLDLILDWVEQQGGVAVMAALKQARARCLYEYIDSSDFYQNNLLKSQRSEINIIFELKKSELTEEFLVLAKAQGLLNLKGHRAVGGVRASCYNAMPLISVERLVNFMAEFSNEH